MILQETSQCMDLWLLVLGEKNLCVASCPVDDYEVTVMAIENGDDVAIIILYPIFGSPQKAHIHLEMFAGFPELCVFGCLLVCSWGLVDHC
jgi:hypothetical protein